MMTKDGQKVLTGIFPLLAGVILALVIIAIVLGIENANLSEVWKALYEGAWQDDGKRVRVIKNLLPLLLCSTGLLLTFTAGLWNIGIEGQMSMGAVGAALIAMFVRADSKGTQIFLEFAVASVAGAAWALLAAILKTRGGVNEIFGGVALNFIASLFTAFLLAGPLAPPTGATGSRTAPFDEFTLLPAKIIERSHLSYTAIGIVVVTFVLVVLILSFSRFGLQLKAIGKNYDSAKALGIPTERNMWLAMAMCGAIAGLAGTILVIHPPTGQLQSNASGGIGFLALLVVLLASIRPALVPVIAFVFAFLSTGAQRVESSLNIDSSLIEVLQGILVLAVLLFDGFRQKIEVAQERRAIAAEAARLAASVEAGIPLASAAQRGQTAEILIRDIQQQSQESQESKDE
jgi:simple sugar transport system permease protein